MTTSRKMETLAVRPPLSKRKQRLQWQSRRLAEGSTHAGSHAPLSLSDFVHVLGVRGARRGGGGGARGGAQD